ncbi:MAG: hypothetical protein R3F45_00500 [Gammaproteobacteria bacterium]
MKTRVFRLARLGAALLAAIVVTGLARSLIRHLDAGTSGPATVAAGHWLGYGWICLAAALGAWGLGDHRWPALYWIGRLGIAGFAVCLVVAVYLAVVRLPEAL